MFRRAKISVVIALGVVFFFKSYVIVIGQNEPSLPAADTSTIQETKDLKVSRVPSGLVPDASRRMNFDPGGVTGRVEQGKAPDGDAVTFN